MANHCHQKSCCECKCGCNHCVCHECCCCKNKTKYIYDCRTICMLQNRASVSVGDQTFWSNTVTIKYITEYRHTSYY